MSRLITGIIVNIMILIIILLRIFTMKMTIKGISSGNFEEANPISRWLLKKPKGVRNYNIIVLGYLIISTNIYVWYLPEEYYILSIIGVLIFFIGYSIDFLWDFIYTKIVIKRC